MLATLPGDALKIQKFGAFIIGILHLGSAIFLEGVLLKACMNRLIPNLAWVLLSIPSLLIGTVGAKIVIASLRRPLQKAADFCLMALRDSVATTDK